MTNSDLFQEWLDKAEEDFQFAIVNLEEGRPFFAQICFHFHQAAEKYLKAYIVAQDLEFRKTHDLPLLLKICVSRDTALEELRDDCEYLNASYIDARYPVHWPANFSAIESKKAQEAAARIASVLRSKLA
jgi:HEPN domain-containing protein